MSRRTLAAARRQAGCETKASRPAVTRLLAKTTSVCPWRRPSRHTGETKRLKLECLSRASCRPSSPAENKRPLTLPGNFSSLPLKTSERMRAGDDVLRGEAGGVPVTRPAYAEYMPHNIVIGSVVAALPQAQHRAAPPLRAAAARVWRGVPATVLGAVELLIWCSCAPVPSRRATPSPPPCSLPRPIRYCAAYIRSARLAPVTPPAFPTAQFEKLGAGKARRASRVFVHLFPRSTSRMVRGEDGF